MTSYTYVYFLSPEGKIVLNGQKVDLGDCKTGVCSVTELKEESCSKNEVCFKGSCQQRSICTFTGPSVIDVYSQTNTIKDRCIYLLFSSSTLSSFSVRGEYMDRRRKDTSFLRSVFIVLDDKTYELEQGGRFKNKGTEESLTGTPKDIDGLKVSKTERGLLVSYTEKGLTVDIFFDGYTAQIMITGQPTTSFRIGGMCGKATATPINTKNSLSSPSCGIKYKEDADKSIDCTKVTESCGVLKKDPFTACFAAVRPDPYVKVCKDTLCAYPSVDNLLCQFLETYARACEVMTTKKVDGWRSNSKCPATPKALCQGTSCSSNEFCGQKEYTGSWTCLCRPLAVQTYRAEKTLGGPTKCDQNKASVSLVNCLLREKGIDYTKLHLNDPSCKGVLNKTSGMVTFGFDSTKKCGTIVTNGDTEVVYQNSIKSEDYTGEVIRYDIVKVDFSCKQVQPEVSIVLITVTAGSMAATITSGSWSYKLTMQTFLDPALSKPATSMQINQQVWVGLKTTGLDPKLVVIVIDSCWVTKTKDPEKAPKYFLISGSCRNPKDNTVKMEGNGKGTSGSFCFNTFLFPDGKSDMFLHCKVKLCDLKAGKTCVPTCGKSGSSAALPASWIKIQPQL
ncbi:alpha-tectorin-like [Halichoeres trimaculatus]|uniref:alpha-tectorin-like n=1 Tax=Halichoeres trimaculatus TaxID=147232 RepID=UPI003D9DFFE7